MLKRRNIMMLTAKVNVKLTKARVSLVERGISEGKIRRNRWINEKAEDRRIVMKLKC